MSKNPKNDASTVINLFNAPVGVYTLKLESYDASELNNPVIKTETITVTIEAPPNDAPKDSGQTQQAKQPSKTALNDIYYDFQTNQLCLKEVASNNTPEQANKVNGRCFKSNIKLEEEPSDSTDNLSGGDGKLP